MPDDSPDALPNNDTDKEEKLPELVPDADSVRAPEPISGLEEDIPFEQEDTNVPDETDTVFQTQAEKTSQSGDSTVPPPAPPRALQPDETSLPDDETALPETTTEPAGSGASIYPGSPEMRAPGWENSGARTREDLKDVNDAHPKSAPMLEPASVPSLVTTPRDIDQSIVGEAQPEPPVQRSTQSIRQYNAVDAAAKELARAALAAEIEKEEKEAMKDYEPEEGEIPPSPEVAKRFDVILQLGKGGMAVVYLCRDPRLGGKIVAVKDIHAEMKPGMRVEERVESEVKLLKSLDHPGIVKVFDLLKFSRGSAIVMEYVDGLPLDHELGAGRRVTWDFGAFVLHDIGKALQYAHDKGVIHRDLKPDNILYSERHGLMKLVDFGLAQLYGGEQEASMTRTGMVVGTPHYMSPEQVSGKQLDQRSDVYSFGATLYYLITGERHVEGSNVMDILEQQRSKDILPPSQINPSIPGWLSYIIGKMMEIRPDDRYQSMSDMLRDLHAAREHPEIFMEKPRLGPVKRYGGTSLDEYLGESDYFAGYLENLGDSSGSHAERRPTTKHASSSRHTTKKRPSALSPEPIKPALDIHSIEELATLVRQVSSRLEMAEDKQVSAGQLVTIVLLCVLVVVLLVIGGLMFAAREGYLNRILGL
ncbi:protein kinase [Planctomycetota bacterium]|nr:protein kinase [Planctomycetota bacterium]